jgi:lipopolysaccharide export system protein LptA
MRKLYILCLVTLAAVFVDIVFFHSRTASAQNSQIEVRKVEMAEQNKQVAVIGNVVGFDCVYNNNGGNPLCFIATSR